MTRVSRGRGCPKIFASHWARYLSHQGGLAWRISVGIGIVRDNRDNVARVSFSALGAGPFQEAPFEQSGPANDSGGEWRIDPNRECAPGPFAFDAPADRVRDEIAILGRRRSCALCEGAIPRYRSSDRSAGTRPACGELRHLFGHCIDTRSVQRGRQELAVVRVWPVVRVRPRGEPSWPNSSDRQAASRLTPPPRLGIRQQLAIERRAGGQHQRNVQQDRRRATAGVTDPNVNRTTPGPLRPSSRSHSSARGNHRRRDGAACARHDDVIGVIRPSGCNQALRTAGDELIERARPAARISARSPSNLGSAGSLRTGEQLVGTRRKTRARQAEL
jgi:hypothetical protein